MSTNNSDNWCDVCKVPLSGPVPAQAHYSGSQHKKKEASLATVRLKTQRSNQDYNWDEVTKKGFCNVCDLELTSQQHRNQHISGSKHAKKCANKSQSYMQNNTGTVFGIRQGVQNIPPTVKTQEVPVVQRRNLSSREYTWSEGARTGYCNVCCLDLTSAQHRDQHISGKPHQKKVASRNQSRMQQRRTLGEPCQDYVWNERDSKGFCNVCKVELTSLQLREQHISGGPHQKKKASLGVTSASHSLPAASVFDYSTPHQNVPPGGYVFDRDRGYCYACKLELSSLQHCDQHVAGKKHVKSVLTFNASRSTGSAATTTSMAPPLANVPMTTRNITQSVEHNEFPPGFSNIEEQWSRPQSLISHTCNLCQQQFASKASLEAHFTSQHKCVNKEVNVPENQTFSGYYPINVVQSQSVDYSSPDSLANLPLSGQTPVSQARALAPGFGRTQNTGITQTWPAQLSMSQQPNGGDGLNAATVGIYGQLWDDLNTQAQPQVNIEAKNAFESCSENGMSNMMDNLNLNENNLTPTSNITHHEDEESLSLALTENINSSGDRVESESIGTQLLTEGLDNLMKIRQDDVFGSLDYSATGHVHLPTSASAPVLGTPAPQPPKVDTKGAPNPSEFNKHKAYLDHIVAQSPKNPACHTANCNWHCPVCDRHTTGSQNKLQHIKGKDHAKVWNRQGLGAVAGVASSKPGFDIYCDVCDAYMNGAESAETHFQGKQHLTNMAKSQAQHRKLPPVKKGSFEHVDPYMLTDTCPRDYQVELFNKALEEDAVVFLPTGTGKTLVSVMLISQMLRANPHRPVVFLVDKVLLVLQQTQVIVRELIQQKITRFDFGTQKMVEREPLVASLCGGAYDLFGIPFWQRDIVVSTAAYFVNLLEKESLRYEDFSLVVFDEVHHCTKEHPFHSVMTKYHKKIDVPGRPKVLGLTASPAGREDIPRTKRMLDELLYNLGGIHIAIVEEEIGDLKKYQSKADLQLCEIKLADSEIQLRKELDKHMKDCAKILQKYGSMPYSEYDSMKSLNGEGTDNMLNDVWDILDKYGEDREGGFIKAKNKLYDQLVHMVASHCKVLREASLLCRSLGVIKGYEKLTELVASDTGYSFDDVMEIIKVEAKGVTSDLKENVLKYQRTEGIRKSNPGAGDDDINMLPAVQFLIKEILKIDFNNPNKTGANRPIVLVLVQKREVAYNLKGILENVKQFLELNINVTYLVGHGASSLTKGMAVNKQDKTLQEIKEHKYQVIVATSVAEEGVDLPQCELVVQMDPPNNVKAMIQIRGRARKQDSRFLALCRTPEQKQTINDLMIRETYMIEACKQIVKDQNEEQHSMFN